MKTSESVTELIPALIAFQLEIGPIIKKGDNKFFDASYAKLEDIRETCNPVLVKHDLVVTNYSAFHEGRVVITVRVFHKSGQWMEADIPLKPAQDNPQGLGSTLSYGQRYGVVALLNLATVEDDDGNEGSKNSTSQSNKQRGFDPKNTMMLGRIHKALANTRLPQAEWAKFIESLKGKSDEEINTKIQEMKRK